METEFFLAMQPPTITQQEKRITVVKGKPLVYEDKRLQAARSKLLAHLGPQAPPRPYERGVGLHVKWCFALAGKHRDGEYRVSKPDTDNLQKLLKDVMTTLHFWRDDALVALEVCEKFWAAIPGIYIHIWELAEVGQDDGE